MADHITIRRAPGTWVVRAAGNVVGESARALELAEGSLPPVIYFPRADIAMPFLERTARKTACPWKGEASHYSIVTGAGTITDAAWSYETPKDAVARIAGHLAFSPEKVTVERL
ncbi:MAG: DUF427 domain-containing protein [Rhodobacteraceae bacterium]|nr:DUF427 domain-containing protein [Paracoccaceae bacterium]